MFDFLRTFLQKRGASENEICRYTNEVFGLVIVIMVMDAQSRLDEKEKAILRGYIERQHLNEILPLLENKYSVTEWECLLNEKVAPLLDSYLEEVLQVREHA